MSFDWRVKSRKRNNWEPWTGHFKTKEEALRWHSLHGAFHEARGYTLKLFDNGNETL